MVLKLRHKILKKEKLDIADPVFWVFTKRELGWMLIFIIIGSFISFVPIIPNDDPIKISLTLLVFTLIITTNIATKKIAAYNYGLKIEHKDWKLIQWWWLTRTYLKKPLSLGLIAPIFLAIFSMGYLKPFTFFQFEGKDIPAVRALKKHGYRVTRRKELPKEEDFGYTAAWGIMALLVLAFIGTLLKPYFPAFGSDLAKFSIYFGLWNLLPAGQLDGAKIFFSTTLLWFSLAIVYTISFLFILVP